MKETEELLAAAEETYNLGLAVEAARERVRALAAEDKPWDRPEMREAVADFEILEARYLALREMGLAPGAQGRPQ